MDKAAKRFVLKFRADRCTFCAQCAESCNFDGISLSAEAWELAALSRDPMVISQGREQDLDSLG